METTQSPRLMIVSDLDYTMVDHQDPDYTSLLRFGALWEADYRHDSLLVYSTGRSPELYAELRNQVPLLTPGIAIMSVGTEIMYGDTMQPDHGWEEELSQGWDRNAIVEEAKKMSLEFQVGSEQRPHKVSFKVEKSNAQMIVNHLSEKLNARGLHTKLIYSGGQDLDVLPVGAGKGKALAYLLKKFDSENRSPKSTLVCGDSGNDAELFAVPDVHGVMVGNAMEELVQWHELHAKSNPKIFHASERCAAGIIQAMKHFNFHPSISPRDVSSEALVKKDNKLYQDEVSLVAHEIVEYHLRCERWLRGEVGNTDECFRQLKCSLDPNSYQVYAHGIEGNLYQDINKARLCHGHWKDFRIWIDRVSIKKVAEGVWAVRFDKWQKGGAGEQILNN